MSLSYHLNAKDSNMRVFKTMLFCLMFCVASLAFANGKLTHMSGAVSVKKANGETISAAPNMLVGEGDVLITGTNGYVRLETTDGGNMVFRPNSEFRIEKYHYDVAKPEQDSFIYSLIKGGLRTVTGLVGKRGNKDAYLGKTSTSTIGIRGTFFEVRVCADDCGVLPNGTYFSLRSGSILVGNLKDNITINTGQVAFVPLDGAAEILPRDPGVGFTAPSDIPKQSEHQAAKSSTAEMASDSAQDGASCVIR